MASALVDVALSRRAVVALHSLSSSVKRTFLDLGLLESGSRGLAVTCPLMTKTNMWSGGVSERKLGSSDC